MRRKLVIIFIFAFAANVLWEHAHAPLYAHYRGGAISEFVLFRAALFDAAFITILGALILRIGYFRERLWFSFIFGVAFALGLETFALATGRWAYREAMPLIPVIHIGVTPALQLGLIAYLIFRIVLGRNDKRAGLWSSGKMRHPSR